MLEVFISCAPNASAVGTELTTGVVPVPVNVTVCGLPLALSVMISVAELGPVAVGLNVTLMVHLRPAAKVAGDKGQSPLIWLKLATMLGSTIDIELIVSGPVPVLVSVNRLVTVVPTN